MIKIKLPVIFYFLFFLSVIACLKPALARAVEYTGRDYRDPLKMPVELAIPVEVSEEKGQPAALPIFEIQGMIWGGIRPQAIINNGVFEQGDIIQEAEIIEIDKQGITFLYRGKKFIIRPAGKGRKIRGE
ncbi:MAG: hypothetical protein U9Q08_00535 [Candidatus Omnitrophota bacterium]|nr:hypothetical protein [Candidatus Omnitrophota bacterium]